MAKRTHIKCHWCKELIPVEEVFIHTYTNKNDKESKLKGHEECFIKAQEEAEKEKKNKLAYEESLNLLHNIFRTITPIMGRHIKNWRKKYEDVVIFKALKLSESAMRKNLDKPFNYHCTIINNNIPIAIRQVEKEDKAQKEKEQIEQECQVITIKHNENKKRSTNNSNRFDIGNL